MGSSESVLSRPERAPHTGVRAAIERRAAALALPCVQWSAATLGPQRMGRLAAPIGGFGPGPCSAARARIRAHLGLTREQARAIASAMSEHLVRDLTAFITGDAFADRSVELSGALAERLAQPGPGLLFSAGHFGPWEAIAARIGRARQPAAVVIGPASNAVLGRFIEDARRKHGVRTILRNRPGTGRRILRILRAGGVVGTLVDQFTRAPYVNGRFFGQPAPIHVGWGRWALRGWTWVHLEWGLDGVVRGVEVEGRRVQDRAQFVADRLEAQVRAAPERWVWFHDRWAAQR